MVRRVNRDVRRVDFRFRLTILGNGVIENALAELNLNILVSKIRDICRGIRAQAKGVSEIELYFGAPTLGGRNFVPGHHGLVERCRRPIAGIAALGGNISMHQADASHTLISLSGRFAGRPTRLGFSRLRIIRLRVGGVCVGRIDICLRVCCRIRRRLILTHFHGRAWLLRRTGPIVRALRPAAQRQRTRKRQY